MVKINIKVKSQLYKMDWLKKNLCKDCLVKIDNIFSLYKAK